MLISKVSNLEKYLNLKKIVHKLNLLPQQSKEKLLFWVKLKKMKNINLKILKLIKEIKMNFSNGEIKW